MRVVSHEALVDNRRKVRKQEKVATEYRRERRARFRGGASADADLANLFNQLGLSYFSFGSRGKALRAVPSQLEGRKVEILSSEAVRFLDENYDVVVYNDEKGQARIHFKRGKEKHMSLLGTVGEKSEQPKKEVKKMYEALLDVVKHELKHERRVRIPGLGILKIQYRKARPKRKGMNPFTKKEMWFKAKDASNKLTFRPDKDLKDFTKELKVVKPHKK